MRLGGGVAANDDEDNNGNYACNYDADDKDGDVTVMPDRTLAECERQIPRS